MTETATQDPVARAVRMCPQGTPAIAGFLSLNPASLNDRLKGRIQWRLSEVAALARGMGITIDDLLAGRYTLDDLERLSRATTKAAAA